MKKLLVSVLAAFMVLSVSSAAFAMTDGDLIAVIYNKTDNELALNLGAIADLDFTLENEVLVEAGTWDLSSFGVDSYEDLNVGVFGFFSVTNYNAYFATTVDSAPAINLTSYNSFLAAANMVSDNYGSGDVGVELASDINSYFNKMNSGTAAGQYGDLNADFTDGEGSLSENGYVDMYLYHFYGNLVEGAEADYTAILRISADGSVILNPTEVPLPGAVILLGSGLLGLAGIRRKK